MFAIGIVGHTRRQPQADQLAETLNADVLSIDNGTLGCAGNHSSVQARLTQLASTWSVVLEDDAQPVDAFTAQLYHALPHAPSPIVSLYLGTQKPRHWQPRIRLALRQADQQQASWVISSHLIHAVGYAIRTPLLPSLQRHQTDFPPDQHISNWARRYGHLISYTVPSLVDHADWPTTVTHTDGPRRQGRKAWRTGQRTHWTSRAVTMR